MVMIRKRRWLWVALFIWVALLLGTLATGWNVVLVQDYRRMLELARQASASAESAVAPRIPAMTLAFGTLGFMAAIATLILFFLKVLKEMKVNQLQSEFLATVSHELKTPIASIELSASLLKEGGLSPEEVDRLWASHGSELKRLREEVETLLESARLQANKPVKLRPTPIPLESWIRNSTERWLRILGPEARLTREGEPLEGNANMDLKTLNLIADNLVDNARKFSRGSPELVVKTRRIAPVAPWSRPRWHIEFSDRGWGFDPKDADKVFSRFYRARTDAPYSIPGSGLGLYLAHSASKALGLTLRAESRGKGRGARFTLEGLEVR